MSEFVEQCRLEWKRLGVPDVLADEMAADLGADLNDAESEGMSAEEFLGSSALDPRSFAASWAGARGIVPTASGRDSAHRRPLALIAFTAIAAIVLTITVLLLLTGQPRAALVTSQTMGSHVHSASMAPLMPGGTRRHVLPLGNPSAPVEWILLVFAIVAIGFAAWLWWNRSRSRPSGIPA